MDIAVIGLGLIGGSAVQALAAAGNTVVGYDADPATRAVARTAAARAPHDARWRIAATVAEAVAGAALTVVAVPAPAVGAVFDQLAGAGYSGLVTDVTSVKGPIRELAATRLRALPGVAGFVGGHPMTGRETSGFTAADPQLFAGCAWVLCLEPGETPLPDWLDLARLITSLGARVVPTTADDHDRAVAVISHVPHLLAAALAAVAGRDPLGLTLAAGSFRDGTRVAASRPELVAAMCGGNAGPVRTALDAVLGELSRARTALDGSDAAGGSPDPVTALVPWLAEGCRVRRGWPVPAPDASTELPATVEALLDVGQVGGWITAVDAARGTVTAVRPAQGAVTPGTVTAARPGPDGSPADR